MQAKCNSVFYDEDRCVHRVLYMSKVRVIVAKVEGGDTLQGYFQSSHEIGGKAAYLAKAEYKNFWHSI